MKKGHIPTILVFKETPLFRKMHEKRTHSDDFGLRRPLYSEKCIKNGTHRIPTISGMNEETLLYRKKVHEKRTHSDDFG